MVFRLFFSRISLVCDDFHSRTRASQASARLRQGQSHCIAPNPLCFNARARVRAFFCVSLHRPMSGRRSVSGRIRLPSYSAIPPSHRIRFHQHTSIPLCLCVHVCVSVFSAPCRVAALPLPTSSPASSAGCSTESPCCSAAVRGSSARATDSWMTRSPPSSQSLVSTRICSGGFHICLGICRPTSVAVCSVSVC